MKYSEAKKQIKALSSKYDINMVDGDFNLEYKGFMVAVFVDGYNRYKLNVYDKEAFSKMPFSNKLYMILSELAMTPLDERVDDKKFQVKVFGEYLNIQTSNNRPSVYTRGNCAGFKTKFTLKEIEQLKQREDIPLDWDKVELE